MNVATSQRADSSHSDVEFPPYVAEVKPGESLPVDGAPSSIATAAVSRLGQWRLDREIGRGGMGVVYEALDTALGRRVALKVLPTMAALEPKKLARFEHEAQVVARLSHPHIVSLYSMGCENDLHFLVMQLIDGVSLDRVAASSTVPLSGGSPEGTRILGTIGGRASTGGEISSNGTDGAHGTPDVQRSGEFDLSHTFHSSHKSQDLTSDQWLRSRLTGERHVAARYIATLGWQAAEALSYAHAMGVIHRDVKPSNLVVDRDHNLWITDFGLAQIQGEQGVTMTGDLLGTLRYMSPEQGMAQRIPVDHRTDVYSLGATLYELLAKRPAFEADDRKELLRQVLFDDPVPLRKHDPHIPPPLQVIVEKAMQKDPRARYATARGLADDLRRWLDGEPILARPPTMIERVAHWAGRRKGAVATGLVSLIVLLVVWAVLGQRHANEIQGELAKTEAARSEAVRGQFQALLLQAQTGRMAEQPGRRLQSLAAVTRAAELVRMMREPARVIANSATQDGRNASHGMTRLRTETIAALGVPFDVELLSEIELDFPGWLSILDAEFRQIARVTNNDGTITVSPLNSTSLASRDASYLGQQSSLKWLSSQNRPRANSARLADAPGMKLAGFGALPGFWQFSADGKRLIAEYGSVGGTLIVWNLETSERAFQTTLGEGRSWANSVAVGDRLLAVIDSTGELRLFDLIELREAEQFSIGSPPTAIALTYENGWSLLPTGGWRAPSHRRAWGVTAPDKIVTPDDSATSFAKPQGVSHSVRGAGEELLAVARSGPERVEFIDLTSHEVRHTLAAPGPLTSLLRSWSGSLVGSFRMLAGYGFWDLASSPPFASYDQPVYMLDVSPQGDLLVFDDITGNSQLRDTRTGLSALRLNGKAIGFDATGELLAVRTTYKVSVYRVHRSEQVRRLRPPGQHAGGGIYNVSFSSDSRTMAVSSPTGAQLYDVASGRFIGTVSNTTATNVAFVGSAAQLPEIDGTNATQGTDDLLVSGVGVPLQRWRKVGDRWEQFERQFADVGSPTVGSPNGVGFLSLSRDGRVIARSQFAQETIVFHDESRFTRLGPHDGLNWVTLSPDGKQCVTGQHIRDGLPLWDTSTGERLRNLWPGVSSVSAQFSSDGRWLLASSGVEFRLFDTESWSVKWQHAREDGSDAPAPIAFSPDNRQMAIGHNQSTMRLYSVPDGTLYAELPLPEPSYIGTATFSPNGRWLTRNTDRTVFVWDLQAIRDELSQRGIE